MSDELDIYTLPDPVGEIEVTPSINTDPIEFYSASLEGTNSSVGDEVGISGSTASSVQSKAEDDYSEYDFVYKGKYYDSDTALTTPFITISGNGSVTREALTSVIASGGSTSFLERMRSAIFGRHRVSGTNTVFGWGVVDITFSFTFDIDQNTNQDCFMGLYRFGANPPAGANATDTARHVGLYIQDGTVYFSNANGSSQTKTDITSSFTFGEQQYIELIWTAGESASVFLNGASVAAATHTTNLPATSSGQEPSICFQIETQENNQKYITLKNNYVIGANIV